MATASFSEQLTRRRRWVAGLVAGALAATAVTIALAYWWTSARQEKPLPLPEALPVNVQKQASGYSFTRSVEGRQIFTIHAGRSVAFEQGGATVLEDVVVEIFGPAGNRRDILRTHQCEYKPGSGDLSSPGSVEIDLNVPPGARADAAGPAQQGASSGRTPVHLETSQVYFKQQGSLAVTDQPVRFRVGAGRGWARGMKYASRDGWLELEKDVTLELPVRGGSGPIRLTAAHLRYDSPHGERGIVILEGPIEVVQGSRRALAESSTVLLDRKKRITQAILEGNVQALDSSPGSTIEGKAKRVQGDFDPASGRLRAIVAEGGVRAESRREGRQTTATRLEAQQLRLTFQGQHPQPQAGTASGDVRFTLDSSGVLAGSSQKNAPDKAAAERKTLSADQIQFSFQPGGKSLSEMQTPGAGELIVIPAEPNLGRREITAGRFWMGFDTRGHPEKLRGLSHTRIVFQPPQNAPPDTPPQVTFSQRLEATFEPVNQTLSRVEQIGEFSLQDGDRQATSERAEYLSARQALTLLGHPQVWDPNTRTSAERILFDLSSGTALGVGKVKSTQFAAPGATGPGADAATHILADRMQAERKSQFVHYEGHVRAWNGTDVVESSSLDVARAERRLSSGLGVLTSHFQPQTLTSGSSHPAATRPVTIRADRLDYLDEGRKARYHGNVQFLTENTTLKSDHMDVYFTNLKGGGASEIERAVADGHVTITQPTRRASGEHANYEAASGKIVLTGGPPTLDDAEKGFTTGQRLTFFLHDDRLLVDGGDQFPSRSKHRVAH